jgi:hypothetical protein
VTESNALPEDRSVRRRVARIVIAVATMVLLTGMGGEAIVAAPILVPALWWAARSSGRWAAAGFTFLAALVMAEVGWFVVYTSAGEAQLWITIGPALAAVATISVFVAAYPRGTPRPPDVLH